ncbi:MAG: RibD family protein [Cyanobacteria bacterium J06623_7]
MKKRPHTTIVLAMTVDGKISDRQGTAARFGSAADKAHLEQQVALADGVIFGAGTLRAYETTISVSNPLLLQKRQERGQPPQPVQIVVSASANFDPQWRFFQQPVPRWLLTLANSQVSHSDRPEFSRIVRAPGHNAKINWENALKQLSQLGLKRLAILGGGELVASLITADLIDDLWLTLCPLILGGNSAPTPVGGEGLMQIAGKQLQLLEVKQIEQELFLHYSFISS